MRGYISYFKTVLVTNLQYKTAALAGICTQFFWGFLQIFIYQAFYAGAGQAIPMDFNNLVTYIWLQQALFALIYIRHKDPELTNSIRNGTVAYELIRPYSMYTWWFIKCLAKKYAAVLLRFAPIILIACALPAPYGLSLPYSWGAFIMFLINILLGSLILAALVVIMETITLFTYDEKGINSIISTIAELFAGLTLPLPLLPNVIQAISYFLPFRLIGDLGFRVYSGDIPITESFINLGFQIFWLIALIIIGALLIKKATKKMYIQGG